MSPPEDRRAESERATTEVRGRFPSVADATRAVRRLARRGIPTNTIQVTVVDARGRPGRQVPVEAESGALRGALLGAAVGAGAGIALVGAMLAGWLGPGIPSPFSAGSVAGALRLIATAAVAGVPLGALLAMGSWQRRDLDVGLEAGESLIVRVRSRRLGDAAQEELARAGARGLEREVVD